MQRPEQVSPQRQKKADGWLLGAARIGLFLGEGCPFGVTEPELSVLNATELYSFKWLVLCVSHLNNKKEPYSHKLTRIQNPLYGEREDRKPENKAKRQHSQG